MLVLLLPGYCNAGPSWCPENALADVTVCVGVDVGEMDVEPAYKSYPMLVVFSLFFAASIIPTEADIAK